MNPPDFARQHSGVRPRVPDAVRLATSDVTKKDDSQIIEKMVGAARIELATPPL